MYELIDARTFGHEIPRPLIIADKWKGRYRRTYDFRADQLAEARETLDRLNRIVYAEDEDAPQAA